MSELAEDELLAMDDDAFEEAQSFNDEQVENAEPVSEEVIEEQIEEVAEVPAVEEEELHSEETPGELEEEEVAETEVEEPADSEPTEEEPNPESHKDVEEPSDTEDYDFETSFKETMKPLKVSGKDVQVKSIDDMRNLAMMGIDYSRKMRDIKPLRAVGETLTQAGIMVDGVVNEEMLTRLIDINNGDKDAIAQLTAEHEIDLLDIDTDNIQYTPTASMVSEGTIALQEVERELSSRGSVENVVQVINTLDPQSRQFFNESPAELLKLEQDITSGAYEDIMSSVQYEKSVGRLTGMSDMEAYIQIASGGNSPQEAPVAPVTAPEPKRPSAAKRKAAGISKRAPAAKAKNYDYVNMSDEEFEALTPTTSLY